MKILKLLLMVISIFIWSAFITPSISSAEDVWCYSDGDMSFYLNSDTINAPQDQPNGIRYSASGKTVTNNKFHQVWLYGFAVQNNNVVCSIRLIDLMVNGNILN